MIADQLKKLKDELPESVTLVAVSKTKPLAMLEEAYAAGQRDFGENRIPEMVEKSAALPDDIHWHMIGHVQTNKVKHMAPFVHLIHAVDSHRLLEEINKQAARNERVIDILIQLRIAQEETKYGLLEKDLMLLAEQAKTEFPHVRVRGLMGMATYTQNTIQLRNEFRRLKKAWNRLANGLYGGSKDFDILSMGMSGDYYIAIDEGSTMVRIGSAIFGARD